MKQPEGTTYHPGELAAQARAGVSDTAKFRSAHQRMSLGKPAQEFLANRPFVVISAQDAAGDVWCSMVATGDGTPCLGEVGPTSLVLKSSALRASDALSGALVAGTDVGVIGIDFVTRSRVRVNCTVDSVRASGDVLLGVQISASHCPQYIVQRSVQWQPPRPAEAQRAPPKPAARILSSLEHPEVRAIVDRCDTMFVGSCYPRRPGDEDGRHGADVSNRCGKPGFCRVVGPNKICFDNYGGNNMYSTLGNLAVEPRVGLTFFDFDSGEAVQVTGTATVSYNSSALNAAKGPAPREGERVLQVVEVEVHSVVRVPKALPGRWTTALSRPLVLRSKAQEAEGTASFYLEPPPGSPPLPSFKSGQHMPVLLEGLNRSYSLSGPPGADYLRISVKNIGQVSSALHALKVGDTVECLPPAGSFGPASLKSGNGIDGVVLVAAGVGVTPMVPMAHAAALPTAVVHAVRNGSQWPFRAELAEVAAAAGVKMELRGFLSRPEEGDLVEVGGWQTEARRVGAEDLLKAAEDLGASNPLFCFCGPLPFSAPLQAALEEAGVPAANIKSESFG